MVEARYIQIGGAIEIEHEGLMRVLTDVLIEDEKHCFEVRELLITTGSPKPCALRIFQEAGTGDELPVGCAGAPRVKLTALTRQFRHFKETAIVGIGHPDSFVPTAATGAKEGDHLRNGDSRVEEQSLRARRFHIPFGIGGIMAENILVGRIQIQAVGNQHTGFR